MPHAASCRWRHGLCEFNIHLRIQTVYPADLVKFEKLYQGIVRMYIETYGIVKMLHGD